MNVLELGFGRGKDFKRRSCGWHNAREMYEVLKRKMNNTDLYMCMWAHTEEIHNGMDDPIWGNLYLDVDVNDADKTKDENFEVARQETIAIVKWFKENMDINPFQLRISFSGSKGFHVEVPWAEYGEDHYMKGLNDRYKRLALLLKHTVSPHLDTGIYDNKRLFRLINTIHSSTGLYCVQLNWMQLGTCSWAWMKEFASRPRMMWRVAELSPEQVCTHLESLGSLDITGLKRDKKKTSSHQLNNTDQKKKGRQIWSRPGGALEGVRNLDTSSFQKPTLEMTYEEARRHILHELDLYELTGLGHTCLCPLHDDHNPSAYILPPRADDESWIIGCDACDYVMNVFDFVEEFSQKPKGAVWRYLCAASGIKWGRTSSMPRKALKDIIQANQRTLGNQKRDKTVSRLLSSLQPVYNALCRAAVRNAVATDLEWLGNSLYFSVSSRYLAEQCGEEQDKVVKKINLLAALGVISKVADCDVPESLQKTTHFTADCAQKHSGRTIQYYRLVDLSSSLARSIMRARLKAWRESRSTISSVTRDKVASVFGSHVAKTVYVKPEAFANNGIEGRSSKNCA